MIEIINQSSDPYFNLALEEYVIKEMGSTDDVFILWQDEPTVVVGRNQNTLEELNNDYIKKNNIQVVRRLSGGGAVYHDLGNLNFTFITAEQQKIGFDFIKFTQPVIKTLGKLGIEAENNGRNDITIEGKKFSGNAQFRYRKKILHHGTILFDSNLNDVSQALNANPEKIISKGVKSVRSRVTNISEWLANPLSIHDFKDILSETISSEEKHVEKYYLSETDLAAVNKLRKTKYLSWAWNYGNSPPFNIQKTARFDWGNIDIRLLIKKGRISTCKIYGDFFASREIAELEEHLMGTLYKEEAIGRSLSQINIKTYLPAAKKNEIIELFFR